MQAGPRLHLLVVLAILPAWVLSSPPPPSRTILEDVLRKRLALYVDNLTADIVRKAKRQELSGDPDRKMVFFDCLPGEAVCGHNGQGPAITYRWGGNPICTCKCPIQYISPNCELTTEEYEKTRLRKFETQPGEELDH